MVEDIQDPRRAEPPYVLGERDMLEQWLEFQRTTLLLKCEGLTDAQRKARPVPTSLLSLHGLVRHMAEVERGWFRQCLLDEPAAPYLFCSDDVEDLEFVVDEADWESDLVTWQAECQASRAAAAGKPLDYDGGRRRGEVVTLRWIYVHMIEEYARHNGHADLIRELADGAVGW
jgi:uncharacterized damage-inducible protein DinB